MAVNSRQVNISNMPADMCEEELQLLFESRRFCPAGGPVQSVDLNLHLHTAVVTFCDSGGILLFLCCFIFL